MMRVAGATVILWSRSAYGQDCDRFNTSRIPEAEPSSILEVDYFSCSDGEFLTSVDVWHFLHVGEVRWACSDGDTSYYPEEFASYLDYSRATFDVGITTVETRYDALFYDGSSDTLVFFGDCYIGGYNFSSSASTSDGGTFVLSGPFGTGSNYTDETWTSSCPDNSYATGVTWWTSADYNFVNGVKLECAEVTSTCYPPALENQDDDLISTGKDDDTGETGSTESSDASSGTTLGIVIAAAIGAAVAVVFVAVAVGLCFFRFRRQKPARGQEIEGSRTTGEVKARDLPLPAVVAAPQIPMPSTTAHPPAYEDLPPAYEWPQAAPTGPPPQYVPPGHARTVH